MAVDASTPTGFSALTSAVGGAIRQAAKTTGASFDYLLATARVESDLNPNLTMKSSTATGLFQFLEQTWLGVLKDAGSAFGYGGYAKSITQTPSGRYVVSDPGLRKEIMALRKDPTANAVMGGAITQQNAALLRKRIGRQPTDGELYVAHFFGPYAAAKVINLASSNPNANAAQMFPQAAHANRPIFYDKQGRARTVAGVYSELVRRYQVARASAPAGAAKTITAITPKATPNTASAAGTTATASTLAFGSSSPDGSGGSRDQDAATSAPSESAGPVFHSLFQSGDRRGPVASLVAQLWTTGAKPASAAAAPAARPPAKAGTPRAPSSHDLFRDASPKVRGLFEGND